MVTLLQAVSEMMRTIREAPPATLEGETSEEVREAQATLEAVSRDVQRSGWSFNTDKNVTLTPDVDSHITVGSDVLRVQVDASELSTTFDPVLRGRRMYERYAQTYDFDESLVCSRIIRFLPWDDLPETAQRYITMRAARTFAARILGDSAATKEAGVEEVRAMRELARHYLDEQRPNILRAPGIAPVATRNPWNL